MEKNVNRQQRYRFFWTNFLSFAAIFIVLGIIVFQILRTSVYSSIDQNLEQLATNANYLSREGDQLNLGEANDGHFLSRDKNAMQPNSFQIQTILWSDTDEIVNKTRLGDRYYSFSSLKLDKKNINKIMDVKSEDLDENKLTFRSITVPISENANGVKYIQILYNTNTIEETVSKFKKVLIICMVIFWLLSIILSFYLSKISMKPIINAWGKQQQFVENASHELRTPLTIIQNKLEGLFTRPQSTVLDESEEIALALNETRRLNKLTSDLLLLARSDSNMTVVKKEVVNLAEFMQKVIEPYQEIAATQNKKLVLTESSTKLILIDPQLIHQLLVILIDNALKYSEANSQVTISSVIRNQQWILEIKDEGKGIKDADKKLIFERFYREDSARQRETGGYGLGLPIAKWIIENHHGKIMIVDNQPQGTIFKVTLPF